MRIRWRRRRPEPGGSSLPAEADEARRAVAAARRAVAEAARRTPEANELAETLRRMRRENHFSARVEAMLRAGWHG